MAGHHRIDNAIGHLGNLRHQDGPAKQGERAPFAQNTGNQWCPGIGDWLVFVVEHGVADYPAGQESALLYTFRRQVWSAGSIR